MVSIVTWVTVISLQKDLVYYKLPWDFGKLGMPLSCFMSSFPLLEKSDLKQVCTAFLAEKWYSREQGTSQGILKLNFVDILCPGWGISWR